MDEEKVMTSFSNTKICAIRVQVHYGSSAYHTNQVCGLRASSMASAEQAAIGLGRKLLGDGLRYVRQVPGAVGGGGVSHFELHGLAPISAAAMARPAPVWGLQ